MIVRLPEMPPMDGEGKAPTPLIVLVGSAGTWQATAARDLDTKTSSGVVVRTDPPVQGVLVKDGYHPELILEGIRLMVEEANLVMIWIDGGPVWLWLELGLWLERAELKCVWGIDASIRQHFHHAGHLLYLVQKLGRPVHESLTETLTNAGIRLQERR